MTTAPETFTALLQKQDGYTADLIEMTLATINPSDLHFLKGEYDQPRMKGKAGGTVALTDVMDTLADVLRGPRGKVFIKP